jgi:hypothetical protein
MPVPRMTTRRWMIAVAVIAVLLWIGIAWYPWRKPPAPVTDPFDAMEMELLSSRPAPPTSGQIPIDPDPPAPQ